MITKQVVYMSAFLFFFYQFIEYKISSIYRTVAPQLDTMAEIEAQAEIDRSQPPPSDQSAKKKKKKKNDVRYAEEELQSFLQKALEETDQDNPDQPPPLPFHLGSLNPLDGENTSIKFYYLVL